MHFWFPYLQKNEGLVPPILKFGSISPLFYFCFLFEFGPSFHFCVIFFVVAYSFMMWQRLLGHIEYLCQQKFA